MAKALGMSDLDSPGLLFTQTKKPLPVTSGSRSVKRSMRRTTMLQPELRKTLCDVEMNKPKVVRRSIRISKQQGKTLKS